MSCRCLWVSILTVLLGGCQTPPQAPATATARTPSLQDAVFVTEPSHGRIHPDWLKPPKEDYLLGPGDKLEIEILGETGTREVTFVTPDGKIYYSLLPGLAVTGLTTTKLKQEMETGLKAYYRNPQVSVTLNEVSSKRVWVLGRLNNPGIYPLKQPLRVLEAVSLAGGLFTSRFTGTTEELADLAHSFLMRGNQMMPVDFQKLLRDGDLSQNIYLAPDDLIYLPSALTNEIYVLGAVTNSQPIGFMDEMNLIAALGRGQGFQRNADLTQVRIVRGSLTQPKVAKVNAKAILSGQAPNVRLQPGDIVYVPGAGELSSKGYLNEMLNTFVRVLAANEGGNAAVRQAQPTGVNINIGNQVSP